MFGFGEKASVLSPEREAELAEIAQGLALYHFASCPFCVRVRQWLKQQGLELEQRDVLVQSEYRQELFAGGGKTQVPCLRIEQANGEVEWLYESMDIIRYLEGRLRETSAA